MRAGKATARERVIARSSFHGKAAQVRQPRVIAAREQGVKSRAVDRSAKGSDCNDCATVRRAAARRITASRLAAIAPALWTLIASARLAVLLSIIVVS